MPKEQTVSERVESENLSDAIADQYDALEAESSGMEETETEITEDAEVEVSAEEAEETTEELETEQVEEQVTEDTDLEEQQEVIAEEEPEYNEPPPERWTQDMRDIYSKLPPDAREMMVENVYKPMQREYTKSTTELSNMRKGLEPLMQMMEQHRGAFERSGMSMQEAIQRQTAWAAHFLDVGAEQGLKDMSASYGFGERDDSNGDEYMTPVERQLKQQQDRIEQRLNQQDQASEKRTQTETEEGMQRRYQEAQRSLHQFANEQKDGKLVHPHVEKVAPQIAGLLKSGLVTQVDDYGQPVPFDIQLTQAYKMACDMNPSIKTVAASKLNKRQVERAKTAQSVDVVTTLPSGEASVADVPIGQSIEEIYDKLDRKVG